PERVEDRVAERHLEDRVVPRLDEVVDPDEGAGVAHARAGEGEPHAHHERIRDEQSEEDDGRREEEGGEQALVLEEARQPRWPGGAGMREDDLEAGGARRAPRDRSLHERSALRPAAGEGATVPSPCRWGIGRDVIALAPSRGGTTRPRRSSSIRRPPTSRRRPAACPGRPWRTCP